MTGPRRATGITRSAAAANGRRAASVSHFHAGGAKVYVVGPALGDEGGDVGYNLGDDGLVVTSARGQILQ